MKWVSIFPSLSLFETFKNLINLQFLSWIRFWSFIKNHRRIEHPRKQYETRDPPEVMQYFGLKWMDKLKILKELKTLVLVKLIFGFTKHNYSNNVHIPVQLFIINDILKKTHKKVFGHSLLILLSNLLHHSCIYNVVSITSWNILKYGQ